MTTNIHPRFICKELRVEDWARLAAYIDGEGCITISRMDNKSRRTSKRWISYALMIKMSNTDPRLNIWLGRFGTKASWDIKPGRTQKNFPNCLPQHIWTVRGWEAYYILKNCLPYFVLKLDQAEQGMAFQESKRGWGRGTRIPSELKADWHASYVKLQELKNPPTEWKEMVQ